MSVKAGMGRLAAGHLSLHRKVFARLGARYPRADVAAVLLLLPLVALGGMGVTVLYLDMGTGDFLRLLAVSQLGFAAVVLVGWRVARRELEPLETWLRDRREEHALAAWRAGTGLPFGLPHARSVLLSAFAVGLAWDILATVELDLGWAAAIVLLAGSAITVLYWTMLAFLSLEHGLKPVVEEVAHGLPEDPPAVSPSIPLRLRLGTALPAINVITGVVVAGVFPGSGGIRDLAIGIGAALAVSASVSLWLTNLLTSSVVEPIASLREAAAKVGRGDLGVRIPVSSGDETADLARAFNEMVRGLAQRERLRDAFGAYVDPELARRVERDSVDLSGQEVDATMLFIDVRGFTSYAEKTDAREVVARLNDLFDCVVPIVLEHGGVANKFIGDGLLAVFGAPEPKPDHADRGVRAAVAIARTVEERYGDDLRVGVGVNSGIVVAGTVGGGGRLDFTVIGDAVNTAARVEAATRQTGDALLVTEATLSRLSDEQGRDWQERVGAALKGKSEEIRLFATGSQRSEAESPRASDRA